MPYVAPGLPPSSTIPNPLQSLAKDHPEIDTDISHDSSTHSDSPPSPHTQTSPSYPSSSPENPDQPIPSAEMISSTPSGGLSEEMSALHVDTVPTSPPADSAALPSEAADNEPSRRGSEHSTKTTGSVPALDPHSASSSSIDSMVDSAASSPGTTTGLTSPLRGVTGLGDDGREGGIARYREGLYAYTRGLYLEAKLSVTKEEKRRSSSISSNGFAPKQSGMEKLAAKKALAKRLNAGNYERD